MKRLKALTVSFYAEVFVLLQSVINNFVLSIFIHQTNMVEE